MTVTMQTTVTVSHTAEEWHLYTHSLDCDEAAQALNEAASVALSCGDEHESWRIFSEAQDRYAAFGAADTEPTDVFWQLHDFVYSTGDEYWE